MTGYSIPRAKKTTSAKLKNDRWKAYLSHAEALDRRYGTQSANPLEDHRKRFELNEAEDMRGYNQAAFDSKWKTDERTYTRVGAFNAEGLLGYFNFLTLLPCKYDTEKSTVKTNRLWSVTQLTKTYKKGTEYEVFVADNKSAYKIVVGRNITIITVKE